jgi:hypothetical protein
VQTFAFLTQIQVPSQKPPVVFLILKENFDKFIYLDHLFRLIHKKGASYKELVLLHFLDLFLLPILRFYCPKVRGKPIK